MRTFILSILLTPALILSFSGITKGSETNMENQKSGKLDILISYERQSGPGSNQYAIWIENLEGELIKTIFVTSFTAQGGYVKRPACTPVWVEKAKPAELSNQQIDAFSGATPQSGNHIYTWDLTDNEGKSVKPGKYRFIIEVNIISKSMVVFKGIVDTEGEKSEIKTEPEYNTDETKNKGIITSVNAIYYPN
jgi:hypothetical protein